jgi:hypothetical protein
MVVSRSLLSTVLLDEAPPRKQLSLLETYAWASIRILIG